MQTEQSTCTAISPVVVDLFEQPAEKANKITPQRILLIFIIKHCFETAREKS